MDELSEFKRILDSDETIIYSYKPNKTRFVWLNLLYSFLVSLIFGGLFIGFGLITKFVNSDFEDVVFNIVFVILLVIGIVAIVLGSIGALILQLVKYNKTCYVVTNKRLVIKTGVIGTDFKTLELKMVQLVDVRVQLLDKLIKPNTGTIIFGSASTPIVDYNYQRGYGSRPRNNLFSFMDINNPYEVSKQIKTHIDSNK